jgi:predicted secreted protein
MSLVSGIAVYFIIWWIVLFAVLPWGIQSQHETGTSEELADPGAPVRPRIGLKALVTTVIAAVIFAAFWTSLEYRLVTLDSFTFLPDFSKR